MYSKTIQTSLYPSREAALDDMADRARRLVARRPHPELFAELVTHAYAGTWQAQWSDALLVSFTRLGGQAPAADSCQRCTASTGPWALAALLHRGWRARGNGQWLCPSCIDALGGVA